MAKHKLTGTETGQLRLMAVDMREQLLPGSFEWALSEIVNNGVHGGVHPGLDGGDVKIGVFQQLRYA
jgi:hypothetical protein